MPSSQTRFQSEGLLTDEEYRHYVQTGTKCEEFLRMPQMLSADGLQLPVVEREKRWNRIRPSKLPRTAGSPPGS